MRVLVLRGVQVERQDSHLCPLSSLSVSSLHTLARSTISRLSETEMRAFLPEAGRAWRSEHFVFLSRRASTLLVVVEHRRPPDAGPSLSLSIAISIPLHSYASHAPADTAMLARWWWEGRCGAGVDRPAGRRGGRTSAEATTARVRRAQNGARASEAAAAQLDEVRAWVTAWRRAPGVGAIYRAEWEGRRRRRR